MALFSILGSSGGLEDVAFLDLFAGTGRVGIEALKRGASNVVMAEVLKDRARDIERLIPAEFAGTGKALVLSLELRRAVAWLVKREAVFDVIFADPPYNEKWGASLLHTKGLVEILKPGGIMIIEHATRETVDIPPMWMFKESRLYGETTLTFVEQNINDSGGIASL